MRRIIPVLFFILLVSACQTNDQHTIEFETRGLFSIPNAKVDDNEYYTPPVIEEDNLIFSGWFIEAELTEEFTGGYIKSDLTLYADIREAETYVVSFETNGGLELEDLDIMEKDRLVLPIPVYDGYIFAGWYKEATFVTLFTQLYATQSTTLYAKWSVDPTEIPKTKLSKPTIELFGTTLNITEVNNATGYRIFINGNYVRTTTLLSVSLQLIAGDSVGCSAYSTDSNYIESEISYITFNSSVILRKPTVYMIDATLYISRVEQAISYEITYTNIQTGISSTITSDKLLHDFASLQAGSYRVVVRALGDGVNLINSNYSEEVVFTIVGRLATPVITLNNSIVDFNPIQHAKGYDIYLNDELVGTTKANSFDLGVLENGVYSVYVIALGDNTNYIDSLPSGAKTITISESLITSIEYDEENGHLKWNTQSTDNFFILLNDVLIKTDKKYLDLSLHLDSLVINGENTVLIATGKDEAEAVYTQEYTFVYYVRVQLQAPIITDESDGTIAWELIDNATGYDIYVNDVFVSNLNTNYYIHNALAGTYEIYVIAKGDGERYSDSLKSATLEITITASAIDAPVVRITSDSISWDAITNATGYRIEVNGSIVAELGQNDLSYTIQATIKDNIIRVMATTRLTGYTNSAFSEEVSYTASPKPSFLFGSGLASAPYEIALKEHWGLIKNNPGAHYILMNNLSLDTNHLTVGTQAIPFTGVFDGNNKTISGVYNHAGLFGYNDGLIKDLVIQMTIFMPTAVGSPYPYAEENVGGIAKINLENGIISNVTSKNNGGTSKDHGYPIGIELWHWNNVGGIVGTNYGIVKNCANEAGICGWDYSGIGGAGIGGVVGNNQGLVQNCTNSGDVRNSSGSNKAIVGLGDDNTLYGINAPVISITDYTLSWEAPKYAEAYDLYVDGVVHTENVISPLYIPLISFGDYDLNIIARNSQGDTSALSNTIHYKIDFVPEDLELVSLDYPILQGYKTDDRVNDNSYQLTLIEGVHQITVELETGIYNLAILFNKQYIGVFPSGHYILATEGAVTLNYTCTKSGTYLITLDSAMNIEVKEFDFKSIVKPAYSSYYEIYVASFADSDGDGTGDFSGITAKLDYLSDLGVTGLWLMPVTEGLSYHGYDTVNYYDVEKDFGTMADFEAMVKACHARGISIMLDMVFNHTSSYHPWFIEAAQAVKNSTSSMYKDYYVFGKVNGTNIDPTFGVNYYAAFGGDMPDLNMESTAVRNEIKNICEFWIDKGVDGFRLDAVQHMYNVQGASEYNNSSHSKNADFVGLIEGWCKAKRDDFYIISEIFNGDKEVLKQYVRTSTPIDFYMYYRLTEELFGGGVNLGNLIARVNEGMNAYRSSYSSFNYGMALYIGNHDKSRIASIITNANALRMLTEVFLSLPGTPLIYYGDEFSLRGTKGGPPDYDKTYRAPLRWGDRYEATWYNDSINTSYDIDGLINNSASLFNVYKGILNARKDSTALRYHGEAITRTVGQGNQIGYYRAITVNSIRQNVLILHNYSGSDWNYSTSGFGEVLYRTGGNTTLKTVPAYGTLIVEVNN